MISSALEAFFRTYYRKPYLMKFSCKNCLMSFRRTYFINDYENEWKKVFAKVAACYEKYRHKNAHPDWISDSIDQTFEQSQEEYNDLVFLSRFYGYLILALTGYTNLEPKAIVVKS